MKIELTTTEFLELKYLHALKYNYLVRDENGKTYVFKEKPHREKLSFSTYRHWLVNDNLDIELNSHNRRKTELATYEFIQFEDEPIFIKDILTGYKIVKE